MTDELEDRIGSLLTRKADRVDSQPGKADLAAHAYRQGLRMRTRRRIVTGVAGLAVLAAVVPAGLNLLGPTDERIVPVETPRPTQATPAMPTKLSEVEIDLGTLPKGAPPGIPWYADGEIHDGERTIPVADLGQFYPVENGYVVQAGGRIRLLNANGEQVADITRYGKFPVVSSDGRKLATATGRTATVLDATTGEVLHSVRLRANNPPGVVGFLSNIVLLGGTATPQAGELWDPEENRITPLRGWDVSEINGRTDGRERLVTAISGTCYAIFDADEEKPLWRLCDAVNPEFIADGRFLVAEKEGSGPLVMDAATGRPLLQLSGLKLMYFPLTWDPSGAVLAWAMGGDGTAGAVVRCTLTGQCEIAAEGDPGNGGALPDPSWLFF